MEPIFIFVSHSHKDLDKVRVLRNYLESLNGEPILFFLKSLSDVNQITTLIKDEIDARAWFIYCKSKNAEKSEWVRSELNYVKETNKENQLIIDLDADFNDKGELLESAKDRVNKMLQVVKELNDLYISYSRYDYDEFRLMYDYASKIGINVFSFANVSFDLFSQSISNAISNSKLILCLLSNKSIDSNWVLREIEFAKKNNKIIVPVILDREVEFNTKFKALFSNIQYFSFDRKDPKASVAKLMHQLYKFLNK